MLELLLFGFIVLVAAGVAALPALFARLWRLHHAPAGQPLAPVAIVAPRTLSR